MPSLSLSLSCFLHFLSPLSCLSIFSCTAIHTLKECALLCSCAFSHNEKSSSIRFFSQTFAFSSLIFSEKKIPCLHVPSYITYLRGPQQPRKVSRKTDESEIFFSFLFCNSNPKLIQQKIFFEKKSQKQTYLHTYIIIYRGIWFTESFTPPHSHTFSTTTPWDHQPI